MDFLKPFVVRQVEQLPQTIFTLWDWLPVILQVLVAVFVIKTVAKWFSREYRDLPKLKVKGTVFFRFTLNRCRMSLTPVSSSFYQGNTFKSSRKVSI